MFKDIKLSQWLHHTCDVISNEVRNLLALAVLPDFSSLMLLEMTGSSASLSHNLNTKL